MRKKTSRKLQRRKASTAAVSQAETILLAKTIRAPLSARGRKRALVAVSLILACAAGGYFAAELVTKPSAPKATVAVIIEGDGVRGPQGMAWIPGGVFLMGSDHKLAQPNERPTHTVRVGGFWMDRTHVTNAQFSEF